MLNSSNDTHLKVKNSLSTNNTPSSSSKNRKMALHLRSNSFPSSSHPLDVSIEDHLSRLQSCAASSSSSSTIGQNLNSISDVYEQVNDLIRLPLNQQVLCSEIHRSGVDQVLEGSLTLLETCDTAKEIVSQMKESILDLQSSLRRKSGISHEVDSYKVLRRNIIKMASKCITHLHKLEKMRSQNDASLVTVVRMAKESESISLSTLKSILTFMIGSKVKSTQKGWSMVTKIMKSNRVSCDSEANEVEKIDQALFGVDSKKIISSDLQKLLEALETIILCFDDGLDSFSRSLVKTRVSLLNVLTH